MNLVEGVTGELYGMKGIAPVVYYQPHSLRGASGADDLAHDSVYVHCSVSCVKQCHFK